jgi:L-fuconolactonase
MPATTPPLSAATPTYIPVRQDWLDRRREPILEPELPIIDPHHHLWDRTGWRYLLDELLAKGASAGEKADLFAGTAARFYRLDGLI